MTASGSPLARQPLDGDDLVADGKAELSGHLVAGLVDAIVEQFRRRLLTAARQVVVEAGQLDPTVHRVLHDLRPDAALADQQALVDDLLDGPPRGRTRQRQPLGEVEFVLEAIPGHQVAVADGGLDGLRQLVVQRNGARPVELNLKRHVASDLGSPDKTGPNSNIVTSLSLNVRTKS